MIKHLVQSKVLLSKDFENDKDQYSVEIYDKAYLPIHNLVIAQMLEFSKSSFLNFSKVSEGAKIAKVSAPLIVFESSLKKTF